MPFTKSEGFQGGKRMALEDFSMGDISNRVELSKKYQKNFYRKWVK